MGRTSLERDTSQIFKNTLILLVGLCLSNVTIAETVVDRLVAEVNGEPITLSDVQEKIDKNMAVEVSSWPAGSNASDFEKALQDQINLQLILQRADELGIGIGDEELEGEIEKFIQRRGLTKDSLQEALKQEGMTYDQYRRDWRKQMTISQFQGREIMPSVKISDKDLEFYYLSKTGEQNTNVKLKLKQLYIEVPSEPAGVKASKEKMVKKALAELNDGLDFEKAVKIYSDNESARANGGSMPAVVQKDLAPVIQKAVSDLEIGEFSDPVAVGGGQYIFYLENKEFAGSEDFEKNKNRIRQQLTQERIFAQTSQWIENQRRRSEIRILK